MLQEPATSQYDLHFSVLGIPVRITWGFWVAAIVLGWQYSQGIDELYAEMQLDTPGPGMLLVIWTAIVLLSILVHELGHSLAMRRFGIGSRIVLYHFGGLAIPNSFGAWNGARSRSNLHPRDSIFVSAAGPGAQLLLAMLFFIVGRSLGLSMELDWTLERYFNLPAPAAALPSTAALYAIFNMMITTSVFWALLNLLPVLPLDGGNIMQNALHLFGNRDAVRVSCLMSVICAAVVAFYSMQTGQQGCGLMFLLLAVSNWQTLQMYGRL